MHDEYVAALAQLDRTIFGDLEPKRAELAAGAAELEQNIVEARRCGAAVQSEIDADAAGMSERLNAAVRLKMATLQHDLSAYMLDTEAIEGFIKEVGALAASGISQAPELLKRHPELMARASRLASKQVPLARKIATDDLPRESAEREQRLRRGEALEQLLKVKDSMLWVAIEENKAKSEAIASEAVALKEAQARAASVEEGANDELLQWSQLADSYSERLRLVEAELERVQLENVNLSAHNAQLIEFSEKSHDARVALANALHEVEVTRAKNEQLTTHNEELIAHAESLRERLESGLTRGSTI